MQVNCGMTNTEPLAFTTPKPPPLSCLFFHEMASGLAGISELIVMARGLLLGTRKATLKHGLHGMEWNIAREHDDKTHARLRS